MKALLVNTPNNIAIDPFTVTTLANICSRLDASGWDARYYVADSIEGYKEILADFRPDVTLCYDYTAGDGGVLRAVNEAMGVPDIFTDQRLLEVFLDKHRAKSVASSFGFMVPPGVVINDGSLEESVLPFTPPYMVKPVHGGDSRGIFRDNVFTQPEKAVSFAKCLRETSGDDVIVEKYINDPSSYEFCIFMAHYRSISYCVALRYSYLIPDGQKYRYLSKEVKEDTSRYEVCLTPFLPSDPSLKMHLVEMLQGYGTFGVVKAEFIHSQEGDYLIEINGIPGLFLCFGALASSIPLSEEHLLDDIFKAAAGL